MTQGLNQVIFGWLHKLAGIYWLSDWVIIFFAHLLPIILTVWFFFIIFKSASSKKHFLWEVIFWGLSLLVSWVAIGGGIHYFYPVLRPHVLLNFTPLVADNFTPATPSGHALFLFTFVGSLYYFSKKDFNLFLALASLACIARVISGNHWPLDILLGATISLITVFTLEKFFKYN
jgi:undecaprenyl-diphosphatase